LSSHPIYVLLSASNVIKTILSKYFPIPFTISKSCPWASILIYSIYFI